MSEQGGFRQSRTHGGTSKKKTASKKSSTSVSALDKVKNTAPKSGAKKTAEGKTGSTKKTASAKENAAYSSSAKKAASGSSAAKKETTKQENTKRESTKQENTKRENTKRENTPAKKPAYEDARKTVRDNSTHSGQKKGGSTRTVQNEKPISEEQRQRQELARQRRRRQYNKHRRLYAFIGYAAVAIAVISAVVIMSLTVLFNITDITIARQGDIRYPDEQIMMYCKVETGQNIFMSPMEETEKEVTRNLPYIEKCDMKIKLPSTVVMELTPAKVMGVALTSTGQRIVLSTGGRALEAVAGDQYIDAPEIIGLTVNVSQLGETAAPYLDMITDEEQKQLAADEFDNRLETAAKIVEIMDEYGLGLRSISFLSDGTVSANYDDRLELMLGMPTGLETKLELAATLISEGKIAKNESGELKLQIDGRATFTPDYLLEN